MRTSFMQSLALAVVCVLLQPAVTEGASKQASAQVDPNWQLKVDPRVLERVDENGQADFLVYLAEQADLSGISPYASKEERGQFVFEQLSQTAERTQGPLLADLRVRGVEHRPFWVANMVWVKGQVTDVAELASRSDVARIRFNAKSRMEQPVLMEEAESAKVRTPENSLVQTGATAMWAQGYTGQNIVIAGADTGYSWDHPALRDQYRGWDGASADHNYNWHDSIHSGSTSCGVDSPEPCDDQQHGTHTMGTMVGDDGGTNQTGMAPGARWIGCRNMAEGFGAVASYSECFQFFIAPTDLNDENPRPDLAPHVINNSWGCAPPSIGEDCDDPDLLRDVVANTRAAGIMVVVSAGNAGSGCGSVEWPPAIYELSYSVGAVDSSDNIAGFSSRGPVTIDGSNRAKPDISAPGVSIRSTVPGGGYSSFSGTSMAGPHVAGLVALLMSAQSCLEGGHQEVADFINATALPRTTTQTCGGVPGSEVPNNTYGWGSIRAEVPDASACGAIFADGFESGDTSAWD